MKIVNSAEKSIYIQLNEKSKEMRKNPTNAEKIFWEAVSNKKIGKKFRRQHIIGKFIVDFFCFKENLIVEIDGEIHNYQKERDKERENYLTEKGYKVIRFSNKEILNDLENVLKKIK